MAQEGTSAGDGQAVGNPSFLVLTWTDPAETGRQIILGFNPTLTKIVQWEYMPLQIPTIAVGGQFFVLELSPNEPRRFMLECEDLPWDDQTTDPAEPTRGFNSLQHFVRYTLNYHSSACALLTPDGQIETVRYLGGLDSFREAEGRSQKAQRWTGTLLFGREVALPPPLPLPILDPVVVGPAAGVASETMGPPPTAMDFIQSGHFSIFAPETTFPIDLVAMGYVMPGMGETLDLTSVDLDADTPGQQTTRLFTFFPGFEGTARIDVTTPAVLEFVAIDHGETVTFETFYTIRDTHNQLSNAGKITFIIMSS